jgi:hypothetical protein
MDIIVEKAPQKYEQLHGLISGEYGDQDLPIQIDYERGSKLLDHVKQCPELY